MKVISERCAGLDIGKDEVVACVRTPAVTAAGRCSELRVVGAGGIPQVVGWVAGVIPQVRRRSYPAGVGW